MSAHEAITMPEPIVHRRALGRLALLGLGLAAGVMLPAQAHILKVFAEVVGDTIHGESYFSSGTFPNGARVDVFGARKQKIGETVTDEHGKFVFTPVKRESHTFVIDAGEGHRAEWTIEADELPDSLPR